MFFIFLALGAIMQFFKLALTLLLLFIINLTNAADQRQNKIEFNMPEKFTDFSSDANRGANDRAKLIKQLTKLMDESITQNSKQKFEITINDIDMAGRFLYNSNNINNEYVRVINDTDRTRLEFSYRMLDSNGKMVNQGDVNLTDRNPTNFKRQSKKYKNTYFSNEMRLFNEWLKSL